MTEWVVKEMNGWERMGSSMTEALRSYPVWGLQEGQKPFMCYRELGDPEVRPGRWRCRKADNKLIIIILQKVRGAKY